MNSDEGNFIAIFGYTWVILYLPDKV